MQIQWENKDIIAGVRISRVGEDGKPIYACIISSAHIPDHDPSIAFAILNEDGTTGTEWWSSLSGFKALLHIERWFPCSMPKMMRE